MSVFANMKTESAAVSEAIKELLAMDTEELYGEDRLHQLSFNASGKDSFKAVFGFVEDLSKCNLDRVPSNLLKPIKEQLNSYKGIFQQARNLTLENTNPKEARDKIVQQVEHSYQALFNSAFQIINFANKAGTNFKSVERQVRKVLTEAQDYTSSIKKSLDDQMEEARKVVESMRVAAAETGVSQNAIHYAEAQKSHAVVAADWKKKEARHTVGLVVYLVVVAALFVLFKGGEKPTLGYLEIAAISVGLLWYRAIRRSAKNYNAEKHNEIANAFKARSLTTFRAFVDATENELIKDQVIVQVSAAAFSSPASGYIERDSEPGIPLPLTSAVGRTISDAVSGRSGHA